MKIIGTTNKKISCIWTTIGKSIEKLGYILNIPTKIYDFTDFVDRRIEKEDDDVIFIFEAGTPQHAGLSMKDMKEYFPNSVFITLSSDSVIYFKEYKKDQLDYSYVDVLMDIDDESISHYTNKYKNLIGEKWLWTTSEWLIESALYHWGDYGPIKSRDIDFIFVAILGSNYRHNMKNYLESKGLVFSTGGGNGHEDNDLTRLFNHYVRSKITLGSSSHNNPNFRTMKGFRDWIGPFLGAPLIYDDYHQVMGAYGLVVPYYQYNDLESIIDIYNHMINNPKYVSRLLEIQQNWVMTNTIEAQLYRIIYKHGIL